MIVRATGANQNARKSLSTDLVNTDRDYNIEDKTAIGDKIVETLYSNRVTFVVFYRQLELRHNIAWTGWGKKSSIFPSGSQ